MVSLSSHTVWPCFQCFLRFSMFSYISQVHICKSHRLYFQLSPLTLPTFNVKTSIPISPDKVGQEVWRWGKNTLYTLHTTEKGKFGGPKEKRKKVGGKILLRIPLDNQTARMHARTKRNETISRLDSSPTSDGSICVSMILRINFQIIKSRSPNKQPNNKWAWGPSNEFLCNLCKRLISSRSAIWKSEYLPNIWLANLSISKKTLS